MRPASLPLVSPPGGPTAAQAQARLGVVVSYCARRCFLVIEITSAYINAIDEPLELAAARRGGAAAHRAADGHRRRTDALAGHASHGCAACSRTSRMLYTASCRSVPRWPPWMALLGCPANHKHGDRTFRSISRCSMRPPFAHLNIHHFTHLSHTTKLHPQFAEQVGP